MYREYLLKDAVEIGNFLFDANHNKWTIITILPVSDGLYLAIFNDNKDNEETE